MNTQHMMSYRSEDLLLQFDKSYLLLIHWEFSRIQVNKDLNEFIIHDGAVITIKLEISILTY